MKCNSIHRFFLVPFHFNYYWSVILIKDLLYPSSSKSQRLPIPSGTSNPLFSISFLCNRRLFWNQPIDLKFQRFAPCIEHSNHSSQENLWNTFVCSVELNFFVLNASRRTVFASYENTVLFWRWPISAEELVVFWDFFVVIGLIWRNPLKWKKLTGVSYNSKSRAWIKTEIE